MLAMKLEQPRGKNGRANSSGQAVGCFEESYLNSQRSRRSGDLKANHATAHHDNALAVSSLCLSVKLSSRVRIVTTRGSG
jgi:hypothetical protein